MCLFEQTRFVAPVLMVCHFSVFLFVYLVYFVRSFPHFSYLLFGALSVDSLRADR